MKHGADVNARVPGTKSGNATAIWYAAYDDRVEVVRYLATREADKGAIDEILSFFRRRPERRDLASSCAGRGERPRTLGNPALPIDSGSRAEL